MGYRNYSTAKGHIVDTNGTGDFTTIAAALTAASSGQTIFIRPGTYTENISLKAGVNLTAYVCDSTTPNVTINGTVTANFTGNVSISGINLQTNGAAALAISGAGSMILFVEDCVISSTNSTGITVNNGSSGTFFFRCKTQINDSQALIAITSGGVEFDFCRLAQTTTTTSTCAANSLSFFNSAVAIPVTTSGTGVASFFNCNITTSNNATCLTTAGTGSTNIISNCYIFSGSGSAVSIGAGTTVTITNCSVDSSNANAITGAGTLKYEGVVFVGSSSTINTSSQTPIPWPVQQGGTGDSSFTAYSVICGGTTSTGNLQNVSGVGNLGQVLTSNGAGALPTWQANSSSITWTDEGVGFNAAAGNGYFITANATATMPPSPSQGNTISFSIDAAATTLTIQANTGQVIRIGTAVSAAAGTATNNARGDSVTLVYRASDTAWIASSAIGTWSVT